MGPPWLKFLSGSSTQRTQPVESTWLKSSGPSTPWTQPYEKAGVDPWKLKRKDGYGWFNPWLELEEVPFEDKEEYVREYKGPSNPQIDWWKKNLNPLEFFSGTRMTDAERAKINRMMEKD